MFLTQTYKAANFISIIFILFLIANLVQSVFFFDWRSFLQAGRRVEYTTQPSSGRLLVHTRLLLSTVLQKVASLIPPLGQWAVRTTLVITALQTPSLLVQWMATLLRSGGSVAISSTQVILRGSSRRNAWQPLRTSAWEAMWIPDSTSKKIPKFRNPDFTLNEANLHSWLCHLKFRLNFIEFYTEVKTNLTYWRRQT